MTSVDTENGWHVEGLADLYSISLQYNKVVVYPHPYAWEKAI